MHDPVSAYIPLTIKEKIWRGEFVHFDLLFKSAKELATDSLFDGDLVLKGGSLTVVNKKPDTVLNIVLDDGFCYLYGYFTRKMAI